MEEAKKLIEDAKWDIKAKDFDDGRTKLGKAKKIAKELRNEELLKEILNLIDESHKSQRTEEVRELFLKRGV